MTNESQKYFEYAQLAQASYGLFTSYAIEDVRDKLKEKDFTVEQANGFLDQYTLVSHQPNTLSGFSSNQRGQHRILF